MRLLFRVLKDEEDARVTLPSAEKIAEYQDVVATSFPALQGAWCVIDRLKFKLKKAVMSLCRMHFTMGGCMTTLLVVFLYLFLLA
jgi:hypothetical protein